MKENFDAPDNSKSLQEHIETPPTKKQGVLKKALQRFGLVAALFGAATGVVEAQKKPEETISTESLPKITRVVKDVDATSGRTYGAIKNMPNILGGTANLDQDVSVMLQHNLKKPESLSEFGKMLVEPVSISLSFPYGKDHAVAKVKALMFGEGASKTQVVDIHVPYEYAEQFDKADPKDREEMKRQVTEDTKKMFDSIIANIFGLSFFKGETLENHKEVGSSITKADRALVEGLSSAESTTGINLNDPKNTKLSGLRAEDGAYIASEIFVDRNIGVDDISFYGSGEASLAEEELEKLAKEAVRLDLSDKNSPITEQVLAIVTKYNDGELNDEAATKLLDELIGSKRKIIIHMELAEQKKILVLPLPLLLFALAALSRNIDFKDALGLNKIKHKPFLKHSFIKSEDPSRPTIKLEDGTEVDRLTFEAERFMMSYSEKWVTFFIVSSNNPNDLETANAYRLAAQRKGIRVLKPKNPRGDSEDATDGYVRVIKSLEPTPEKTEEEAYVDDFGKMAHLVDFGEAKVLRSQTEMRRSGELDENQQIIILAFGEGDAMEHALDRYYPTKNSPTKNLEVIKFGSTHYGVPYRRKEGDIEKINVSRKGKVKTIKGPNEEEAEALTLFRKKNK